MSTINYQGNSKYRYRLFRMLFNDRDNIASLCSALGEEVYTANDIEDITTIDDVIYIKMKNDISFLLDSYLFLWKQQSTVNPNMPLRGLM